MSNKTLRELFDRALVIGGMTHTLEDIEQGIAIGQFQYWSSEDSCAITEVLQYPQCKKLHVFLAAGNFQSICDKLLPQASQFARENGCVSMTTIGRKGFVRRIPKYGFKPKYVVFELDLMEKSDG